MNNYTLITLIASTALAILGFYLLNRRTTEGARTFSLFLLAGAIYSFGCAMEVAAGTLAEKQFWLHIEYIGIPFVPTLALIFSVQYVGKKAWLTPAFVSSVVGFSVLTMILQWTTDIHHLYYATMKLDTWDGLLIVVTTKGFWYWLFMAYTNLAALGANALLLFSVRKGQRAYRKQTIIISIGSLAPWVFFVLFLIGLTPGGLDITPLGFVFAGAIYVWGTFRYQMLDLVPMALESILENMKDGMILIDEANRLLTFNKSAIKILAKYASPVVGMNLQNDFRELSDYMIERASGKTKESVLTVGTGEERCWFQVNISPILDRKGHEQGKAVIFVDITDIRNLESQIIQTQKLEALGNIAAGIAHDFNNLLGVILGYSELIGRAPSDQIKVDRGVKAIAKSAERGKSLVNQLLTFARKTDTSFTRLQINDVIREIEKLMAETFPKTIEVSARLVNRLPFVLGDPTQMHQVLLNMCVNARDAMERGGTLTISTGTITGERLAARYPDVSADQYVEIQLVDTGKGMDEPTRQKVFEPFFTTKGVGRGTGLGLSVAYGLVKSHGGYIDVDSKMEEGTTFKVYLPATEDTPDSFRSESKPDLA